MTTNEVHATMDTGGELNVFEEEDKEVPEDTDGIEEENFSTQDIAN